MNSKNNRLIWYYIFFTLKKCFALPFLNRLYSVTGNWKSSLMCMLTKLSYSRSLKIILGLCLGSYSHQWPCCCYISTLCLLYYVQPILIITNHFLYPKKLVLCKIKRSCLFDSLSNQNKILKTIKFDFV